MLKSSVCDYGHAYALVSGTIIIAGAGNDDDATRQPYERDEGIK